MAVSIRRERLDDGREKDGMQFSYRVTFRTSQVTVNLRLTPPSHPPPTSQGCYERSAGETCVLTVNLNMLLRAHSHFLIRLMQHGPFQTLSSGPIRAAQECWKVPCPNPLPEPPPPPPSQLFSASRDSVGQSCEPRCGISQCDSGSRTRLHKRTSVYRQS